MIYEYDLSSPSLLFTFHALRDTVATVRREKWSSDEMSNVRTIFGLPSGPNPCKSSARRPAQLTSTNDMQVKMKDALTGALARVGDHTERVEPFLLRNCWSGDSHHMT